MRVLLIWPNSRNEVLGWGDLGAVAEPLALEYLAAGIQPDGHTVRILDLRLHPDALERTLDDFLPDVVGVTAYSMHVLTALAICRRVKAWRTTCSTVAGGHHATLLPEDFFQPQVDFVVVGEGIRPFRTLLQGLAAHSPPPPIPGVWARVDGSFALGGEPLPLDLNSLPLPDRSATTHDRPSYFIDWMKPVALVRTTVGCPYRCNFCSLWRIAGGRYLLRDIDAVVQELAAVREECVFLVDDEAFIHGRRMSMLAQAVKAAGIRKRYFTYCRIDTLLRQREAVAAWRDIGLERLFIGIDGITEVALREYNKKLEVSQLEAGLRLARDLGVEVFAQFIVNPSFTRRDFQQLVRFIEHHGVRYPSFTVLTPIPGTDLLSTFDEVVERQSNGRPNWDLFDCQNAVTATRLPRAEFQHGYRSLQQVFNGAYIQYREHSFAVERSIVEGEPGALTEARRRGLVSNTADGLRRIRKQGSMT
jgi:radical SAM superfamily enzyme YgiQ (UPF0313 family)